MQAAWTLLRLPAFVWGLTVLFWCFQGACLTGQVKWWKLWGTRNDAAGVLRFLKAAFGFRLLQLGERKPETQRKCMYLCNHRGWCDFFVDMYAVGAHAVPLARRAVGAAFPAFSSSLVVTRSILLFNRGGVRDTEKFNAWLDRMLDVDSPQNSLMVYPEGTRSLRQQSLPLKRGMLRYAFTRKLPVQCVLTAGKEQILAERWRWVGFGRTLVCGSSEVLETSQYSDFEEFMAAVQALWDAQWERVHAASPEGLPELAPSFPALRYTPAQLAAETAALALWGSLLAAGAYACFKVAAAVAAAPGGPAVLAAGAVWWAASMVSAWTLPAPGYTGGGGRRAAADGSSRKGTDAPKKQE